MKTKKHVHKWVCDHSYRCKGCGVIDDRLPCPKHLQEGYSTCGGLLLCGACGRRYCPWLQGMVIHHRRYCKKPTAK